MSSDDTFPKLLVRNAERYAARTALREKRLGIWHPTSWAEYRDAVRERGRAMDPEIFARNVAAGDGEDLALICYTSGTTGFPKGAMLNFRNLLTMVMSLNQVDERRESDEFVSFLPLAWIGEQMMSIATALAVGFTVNFPEEPETSAENIREIGPHVLFGPPRFWENLTSMVQVKIMDTTRFKRFMYQRWMPVGYKLAELRF